MEHSRLPIATFQNPKPKAIMYLLKIREGEKSVMEEPIMFTGMYRSKMSKDLELVRLKMAVYGLSIGDPFFL